MFFVCDCLQHVSLAIRFVSALAPATEAAVAHTEEICKRVALET